MIYVFGHKSSDTDTIISSIAWSRFKEGVTPARIDDINPETKFILEKFNLPEPKFIKHDDKDQYWLVDHNTYDQSMEGLKEEQILGVIDHHKLGLNTKSPIFFHMEPVGSTCTIIAKMFFEKNKEISKELAGAMLGGILSDTVIFKSTTTTDEDREIAKKLANLSGIKNIEDFGMDVKRMACNLESFDPEYEVNKDFKKFETGGVKYGVGQIETVCIEDIKKAKDKVLAVLQKKTEAEGLYFVILIVTDIMKEGSELWVAGVPDIVEESFGKLSEDAIWLDGVMSRKKQIIPKIDKVINKD